MGHSPDLLRRLAKAIILRHPQLKDQSRKYLLLLDKDIIRHRLTMYHQERQCLHSSSQDQEHRCLYTRLFDYSIACENLCFFSSIATTRIQWTYSIYSRFRRCRQLLTTFCA